MVNDGFTALDEQVLVERRVVLSYVQPAAIAGAKALLALDDTLADIVRAARDPLIGQMRLAWWREALVALETGAPPAQPVLQALAQNVTEHVGGSKLAAMVDGWEELLDGERMDEARLIRFAEGRGAGLFAALASALGAHRDDPIEAAGAGWALANLARGLSDPNEMAVARALAAARLTTACSARWSRNGRALGAMTHAARLDLAGHPVGAPRRVMRLLWHRLSGH